MAAADVRVALFGPAADFWRDALSERIQEQLGGPDDSVVWVVDADQIPDQVPPGCVVVVFSLGEMPESDLPDLWQTNETPERWVPAMYASLAEGRTLDAALKVGGPTPIRIGGKAAPPPRGLAPRSKPVRPQKPRGKAKTPKA